MEPNFWSFVPTLKRDVKGNERGYLMPEKPTCEELGIISIPFDTQLPICYTSQVKCLKLKEQKWRSSYALGRFLLV
jgi:hypothetical protein